MVAREIVEKIYYFIKDNPDKTKNQVVNGMKNEYSRLTILEGIDVLLDNGKISHRPKDKPKGFYHLYTNDKNKFNKIVHAIEPLESWIISRPTYFEETNPIGVDTKRLHLAQLQIYVAISLIASEINNTIESLDDRNVLFLRLVKLLVPLNHINEIILTLSGVKRSKNEYLKAIETEFAEIFGFTR